MSMTMKDNTSSLDELLQKIEDLPDYIGGEYDIESIDNGDGTQELRIIDASKGGSNGGLAPNERKYQYAIVSEVLAKLISYIE